MTEEADNLLPKIVHPLIRLLKASGVRDASIFETVGAACREYESETIRGVDMDFDRYCELADVVMVWARDPEFIDEAGLPQKLYLDGGQPSFRRLVEKAAVNIDVNEVVKGLRKLHSVHVYDKNRQVRLVSHVLLSVTPNHFVVGAVLDEIRRFLETIEHNVCENPDALDGRMQRTVLCASLDPKRFPEAQRFVRLNAQGFLDALDEKLSTCRSKTAPQRLRYGAGIYVFVDKNPNTKSKNKRRLKAITRGAN